MVGNNISNPPFFLVVTFLFFFRLDAVMCMGVTAGAYILTLFAVCFPPWRGSQDFLLDDSKFCIDLVFNGVFYFALATDEIQTTCPWLDTYFPSMQCTLLDRMAV